MTSSPPTSSCASAAVCPTSPRWSTSGSSNASTSTTDPTAAVTAGTRSSVRRATWRRKRSNRRCGGCAQRSLRARRGRLLPVDGDSGLPCQTLLEVLAHHLSTPPEPPSARLGGPIAPDLERLILQCLAKSPADRPHDSKALQLALSRLSVNGTWKTTDAAAWWERYRRRYVAGRRPAEAPAPRQTVTG